MCLHALTACNVPYSTFLRLAAILLLMAVASLVPTANLGTWITPTSIQYTQLFSSQLQIGCTLSQSPAICSTQMSWPVMTYML
ncbi:hypothetical protein B0H14DRAFT_2697391 [Mycena olivaceomarginata]|nr:hypothetical protein B0H14DRAFT_2697391 [Mycena olivaceomarginata]